MKTQQEIKKMKDETVRLIEVWAKKPNSDEKDQVLNQLIGQRNILLEVLK